MGKKEKLINLIAEQLEGVEEIDPQSSLTEIGYDSLKFIFLVLRIEREFDIEFEDGDLNYQKFSKVNEIVDYVVGKL